ncbi:hypothetical protein BRD04_10910 [Halobacteriales archaeon QS_9_67_17]|nr:MAG: hypothetical protein BRD04_10910 [Halobacteriales archaeon QS_9_67_17]
MARDTYSPRIASLPRRRGVRVDDPVEDVQFTLYADDHISADPVSTDAVPWCFPVDTAARLDTNEFQVPIRLGAYVRRPDGSMVAAAANDESIAIDTAGPYTVEFTSTPIKLFVFAESGVRVTTEDHQTTLSFPDVDGVHLAARSLHEQPARTLTVPRDAEGVMRALSESSAALKTTTCERSFPTLRGHPPLVEFGEEVDIPGGERRPDSGVRLELPPEPRYVFPAAPLAYYLAAEVVPGDTPRLTTTAGVDHQFDPAAFKEATTRLLQHVFTLDCLTRVEGYYPVELAERRRAAERGLDLDWAAVYDQPLAEQLGTYLSVPFEAVEPLVPEWRLTADIVPDIDRATVLPHLANELAAVRIFDPGDTTTESEPTSADTEAAREAVDQFHRGTATASDFLRAPTRTADDTDFQTDGDPVSTADVLRVPDAETTTQTYIGDGFPLNANKGSRASYERQLSLRAEATDHIGVTVVCNDEQMIEELEVGDYYGTRELFEFDVTLRSELTRDQLREVLAADTDFIHYIGHVDDRGLQATDGYLDAHDIEEVNTTAFILNGCRSFRQGQALVDRGAVAGIVTLDNIHNSLATEIGTNIARLLNRGFPLDAAVEVVKDDALVGRHYIVVGDGSVEIVKPKSGALTLNIIRAHEWDESFDLTMRTYVTESHHLGTLCVPHVGENQVQYLASGIINTSEVSPEQLDDYLGLSTEPVQLAGEIDQTTISLRWSDSLTSEKIRSLQNC